MTVARVASRAVFAFSSALLVIALCDLWQWFWHAHIRTWHLSLQGLVLLTLMVSLGVVTWKAMRAAREFAETNGQNGLVVYSGYGHLAAACVPTAMVLFVSDEGWLLGYNAVLAMALIVCGWQAARYNRGLQVVRSLLVQIVFPFLFVFLGMFAAVHASSEENRQEEEVVRAAAAQINSKILQYRQYFNSEVNIKDLLAMVAFQLSLTNLKLEKRNDTAPFMDAIERLKEEVEACLGQ